MERKLGQFDSWTIESEDMIVKKCDKSFFEYRGSGVPANIRWFFDVVELEKGGKRDIVITYEGIDYSGYISCETNDTARTRMFWDVELAKQLDMFNPENAQYPNAVFEKKGDDKYLLKMEKPTVVRDLSHQEFWQMFNGQFDENATFSSTFNKRTAWGKVYYDLVWGGDKVHIVVRHLTSSGKLKIELYFDDNKSLYEKMKVFIDEIQEHFVEKVNYTTARGGEDSKARIIYIEKDCLSKADDSYWKRQIDWIQKSSLKLKRMIEEYGSMDVSIKREVPKVTEWFISGNPTKYDVIGAFRELGKVDWKQSSNIAAGDIVYVYVSHNIQSVRFKCVANKVDLKVPDIEDSKFNRSGEYDGTYGRYMELEMIEELEGPVYGRKEMARYGFQAPQSPARVQPQIKEYLDIVQKLQHSHEMEPDLHDGSYELIRTTIDAYAQMDDLSVCDYKDLNLVYLTCVGTWKQGIAAKKNTIRESHLPEEQKERLIKTLDHVCQKAAENEYSNHEGDTTSIGMFGTGFFTFKGKTDEKSPRNFIQMCIDIKDMEDEEEIFSRCEQTLDSSFHGMKAASASMVLHCLKPTVFPIFNSNMGAENIFVYLGVEMKWKTELHSYIKNARLVKAFRDANFTVKNYRIFDIVAWEIGSSKTHTTIDYLGVLDYLENNHEVPYSNPEAPGLEQSEKDRLLEVKQKGQAAVGEMKKMVAICNEKFGLDKCEPMSWLDGSNTKTRKYLWAQMKKSSFGDNPVSVSLFAEMSKETSKARYRVSLETKNDGTSVQQMQQYHSFLDMPLRAESTLVYVAGSNEYGMPEYIDKDADEIRAELAAGTYKKVQLCRIIEWDNALTNDSCEEAILEAIEELMPYYNHVIGDEEIIYWPSLEEYNPGITKEQWMELLNDSSFTKKEDLRLFKCWLLEGGESTCANAAEKYGGTAAMYNMRGGNYADSVSKRLGIEPCADGENMRTFPVVFLGRNVIENGKKRYSWKLRKELKEALEEMDLSSIEIGSDETKRAYDKNMILYGPPGTGKTYNSAIYAVAICDGKEIEDLKDYDAVMERYNELKEEGRVAFTTFHQSYGYEEFIEGIKPIVDSDKQDIGYTIEPGVFKRFCKEASDKTEPFVFVIDEINRGNISKIFGELITLIESTKRAGMAEEMSAILPYSGDSFSVPSNVYILGTMNTADRSIALMDTALRRRFQFIEMMPKAQVLRDIGADKVEDLDVAKLLETINERIEFLYDREHTIGHAFFTGLKADPTVSKLRSIFEKSVIPLLQEYFYEDYQKIQMVFGDNDEKKEQSLKLISDEEVVAKKIFKGSVEDIIDLPPKKYKINSAALDNIESYKQIM